jgi:DNA-binding NtrC family response regulator
MQKVLLVDDDSTLLSSLGEFLELTTGVTCVMFEGLSDLAANEQKALDRDIILAVIDINLGSGRPSGIDVYQWLSDHKFREKCVFLTGHAKDHPLVKQAGELKGVEVCEKPMEMDRLISLIEDRKGAEAKVG